MNKMRNKPNYNIDIITTDGCNLRCKYCTEAGFQHNTQKFTSIKGEVLDKLIEKIDYMIQSDWFHQEFSAVRINFWGGEPTLNVPAIEKLLTQYEHENRVVFYIFTNAYSMDKLFPILEKYKNMDMGQSAYKLGMQISYDGLPVQNVKRLTRNGEQTSEIVRENIKKCIDANIPFGVHPVITTDTFKLMYDSYLDYLDLYKYLQEGTTNKNPNRFQRINIGYSPNLDYFNTETDNFKLEYISDLYSSMSKIGKHFKETGLKTNSHFFLWLNNHRQTNLCSVGRHITAMDGKGKFYFCHGAFFQVNEENQKSFTVTNIDKSHEEWLDDLRNTSIKCAEHHHDIPDKCRTCETQYCLRCQIVSYNNSDKKEFWDKWTDYNSNNFNCKLFNLITLFRTKILSEI